MANPANRIILLLKICKINFRALSCVFNLQKITIKNYIPRKPIIKRDQRGIILKKKKNYSQQKPPHMKKIIITICIATASLSAFSQNGLKLIAKKGNNTKVFETGNAVNIMYKLGDTSASFRGRIAAINNDGIVLRHYRSRDTSRVHVPLNDFTDIRKISRTGRTITGIIFCTSVVVGVGEIALNQPAKQITLPNIFTGGTYTDTIPAIDNTGAALATIAIGALPYIIVTLAEPKASKSKGYTFMIAAKQ